VFLTASVRLAGAALALLDMYIPLKSTDLLLMMLNREL